MDTQAQGVLRLRQEKAARAVSVWLVARRNKYRRMCMEGIACYL